MTIRNQVFAAACLAALAGAAAAGGASGLEARQDLMRQFPGVRAWQDGARTRVLYGTPMTTARSPRLAAEAWLAAHGEAFGVGGLDLVERWAGDVRFGKFEAFTYSQMLGGLPVENSPGRVLVRNNLDGTFSVVYAAGVFAKLPEGGFAPMTRTAQDALNFIQGSEFGRLPKWSAPTLVAWQPTSGESNEAVRAWKFVGENPDLVRRAKHTFFVDAATGALLEARNEVHNADVFGFVKGKGSPGRLPDEGGNPPVLLPINDAQVGVSGGNNAYSDATGFFDITHGGNSNVTISANFDTGQWCNINNQATGGVLSASATATPGQEAYLEFNSSPSQYLTAQVNAFIHTGLIHNFIADRSSWNGMDFRCTTNVNIASTCNAYFDGNSINFFRSGGGCNNTAYSTVVAHEYGHYIVARQGLAQGAFGEGYGDVCAELLYDTGIIGEHFTTGGGSIRNNDNTIRKYPCSGEVHYCGQLLGGVWWHMRENFGATYGSALGLEEVQQLMVDWTIITTGGQGDNAAHPGTVIEVLTLDDDDGNINNGTPNFDDITAAFELHEVPVPEIVPLVFLYPDGLPELVSPAGGTSFHVQVLPNTGFTPEPGTGVLHVDTGSGFVEYPMAEVSDNFYMAEFPAIECQSDVSYYITAEATDGALGRDPQEEPAEAYAAYAAESRTLIVEDDFESDTGFSVVNEGVNNGAWVRGGPTGDNGGNPTADYDGSGKCYITGNFLNADLDGGPTRLVSAAYDLSGTTSPTLSYARWFYNGNPQENGDRLVVELSADDGATWTEVESVTHQGKQWTRVVAPIADYIPLTGAVRVRFSANDGGADSLTEAGIDALIIEEVDCGETCVADFNGDDAVNTQDVIAFLNAWTSGDSSADVNEDGAVNTQDVIVFLNLWNTGC
ncbi:MAG TPA: GC-type dockerin domain-anchored protein [Phycisphaerales bacterium]|nr:GC-type dockerin domain-anchored protein [Phycisphaerales bacterium]